MREGQRMKHTQNCATQCNISLAQSLFALKHRSSIYDPEVGHFLWQIEYFDYSWNYMILVFWLSCVWVCVFACIDDGMKDEWAEERDFGYAVCSYILACEKVIEQVQKCCVIRLYVFMSASFLDLIVYALSSKLWLNLFVSIEMDQVDRLTKLWPAPNVSLRVIKL